MVREAACELKVRAEQDEIRDGEEMRRQLEFHKALSKFDQEHSG